MCFFVVTDRAHGTKVNMVAEEVNDGEAIMLWAVKEEPPGVECLWDYTAKGTGVTGVCNCGGRAHTPKPGSLPFMRFNPQRFPKCCGRY